MPPESTAPVEIIPAILPKSFDDLRASLTLMQGVASIVQVDVVDGVFALNTTWPYQDLETFERILSGEEMMPLWEDFDFEFDLMVESPEIVVEDYIRAGASRMVLHTNSRGCKEALEHLRALRRVQDFSCEIGVAVLPGADMSDLEQIEGYYSYLQVMGIEKVGFQGQAFDQRAVQTVHELSVRYPGRIIQVDGGVTLENALSLAHAGATRLIVGSAIFGSDNPQNAYTEIFKEANHPK